MPDFQIETERLILRGWEDRDAAHLLSICTDVRVMEFLGPLMTEEDVWAAISRQRGYQERLGHCYWAIERKTDGAMIGFCGLQPEHESIPAIGGLPDIGWRLAHSAWGQGYAKEAALGALGWGFANLDDDYIWAITVPANFRSWRLMQGLGMSRQQNLDFDHPNVPDGSPLKRHIAYSISKSDWKNRHLQ